MHGFKPHKGLLKRVTVTRNGKVKHAKAGQRHRKSLHKSAQNRQLRQHKVTAEVERKRLRKLLNFRIRPDKARDAEGNVVKVESCEGRGEAQIQSRCEPGTKRLSRDSLEVRGGAPGPRSCPGS